MTNPLTWKTLAGLQFDPNQTFKDAISNINQLGFGSVNKALTGYQQQEGELFTEDKAKNQQAAIEALRQYKTPEELQAAIASGAVNQLLDPMGNRVDRSKVINYADARVKDLRTDITAEQTFKNLQEKAAVAPFMDKAKALYASGYVKEADDFVKANEPLFKNYQADIINFKNEAEKQNITLNNLRNSAKISTIKQPGEEIQASMGVKAAVDAQTLQGERSVAKTLTDNLVREFEQSKSNTMTGFVKALDTMPEIPRDKRTGLVDFNSPRMTDEMRVKVANLTTQLGIDPVEQTSGALEKLKQNMIKAGLSPAVIEETIVNADKLVKDAPIESTASGKERLSRLASTNEKWDEEKKKNIFYQNPEEISTGLQGLAKKVNSEIKDAGNIKEINTAVSDWALNGIKVKRNGVEQTVKVPIKVIEAAYEMGKEVDSPFYQANRTVENTKEQILNFLQNPEYMEQMKRAEDLATGQDKRDLLKIQGEYRGGSGTISRNDLLSEIRSNELFAKENIRTKEAQNIKRDAENEKIAKQKEADDKLRKELEKINRGNLSNKFFIARPGRE